MDIRIVPRTAFSLENGDRVRFNLDRIRNRQDYKNLTVRFKLFVFDNMDRVFTVRLTRIKGIVELMEAPQWLFQETDLIKVESTNKS